MTASASSNATSPNLSPIKKIYPRHISGRFQRLRLYGALFCLSLFFLTPWLSVNGQPMLRMDFVHAEFYLFATRYWPQDLYLVVFMFIIAAVGLFAITAWVGRVWCGYSCPQTVWTSMFMGIERWCEGSRNQRLRRDRTAPKLMDQARSLLKHALWLLLALLTGITIVGYFSPIEVLLQPEQWRFWPLFWVLFFAATTYLNAGWLRENVCNHICPYSRFQSVMVGADTKLVSYDLQRGEPRGAQARKATKAPSALGDCVDCTLCVQVCPTGIDIRDGVQLGCINCGLCVDACDQIMDRLQKPRGLIAYASENQLQKKPAGGQRKQQAYAVVMLLMIGVLWVAASQRPLSELDVVRERNRLYTQPTPDLVANTYTLRIINKTPETQHWQLSVEGLEKAEIQGANVIAVPPSSTLERDIRVLAEFDSLPTGINDVRFVLTPQASDAKSLLTSAKSRFIAPVD